jgi:hypothetical protein
LFHFDAALARPKIRCPKIQVKHPTRLVVGSIDGARSNESRLTRAGRYYLHLIDHPMIMEEGVMVSGPLIRTEVFRPMICPFSEPTKNSDLPHLLQST